MSKQPRVIMGVAASVSAYKAIEVLRLLRKTGVDVWVSPTRASLEFVGAKMWESLSGHPVYIDSTDGVNTGSITHVELAESADALLVCAATVDILARLRVGMANDFLTLQAVTVECPCLAAPAMHSTMWRSEAVQDNVAELRKRGWIFVGPEAGFLADNSQGIGRLADPETIVAQVLQALEFHK